MMRHQWFSRCAHYWRGDHSSIAIAIEIETMKRIPLAIFLAFSALIAGTSADGSQRPNILLIVCDDLNTHVSTSGYGQIQTPTFDALAKDGMTFSRAFCQYPVCGPSRASFLSGLHPESTGVLDNKSDIRQTRPNTVSMPQYFKENGYWTAAIGKVFHNEKADHGEIVRRSPNLGYAVRNQDWRYGKWPGSEELYDLTNDPHERNNVGNDPKFRERLESLRAVLATRQKTARGQRVQTVASSELAKSTRELVLAYYYPWYTRGDWSRHGYQDTAVRQRLNITTCRG